MAENTPKLKKDIKPQKQEALQSPRRKTKTKSPPSYITAKLLITINKEDSFNERKRRIFFQRANITITADFSTETIKN